MARPWITFILALVVLAAGAAGCPPEKPSERSSSAETRAGEKGAPQGRRGQRVAVVRVDGEPMSLQRLEDLVEDAPEYVRARVRAQLGSEGNRRAYLRSLAQFQVMADVAERGGFGDAREVAVALDRAIAERTLREAVGRRTSIEDVTDAAVEAYYRDHRDAYRQPERRAALAIVFGARDRARRVRDELADAGDSIDARIRAFRRRAANASIDSKTAQKGGALGWLAPPEAEDDHPAIAREVFALDARGAVSDVFEVGDRWYIVTWRERRPPERRELEEVAPDIRRKLHERRKRKVRRRLLEKWRRAADVERREQVLDELEPPAASGPMTIEDVPLRTVHRGTGEAP